MEKKSKKTIIKQPFFGTKITYLRDPSGQPIGVVAVHRVKEAPEHLAIGISIRHRVDTFDRAFGRNIAMGRAIRLHEKFEKNDQLPAQPYALWAYDVDYRGGWENIFKTILDANDTGNISFLPRRIIAAIRARMTDPESEVTYAPKLSLVRAPVN